MENTTLSVAGEQEAKNQKVTSREQVSVYGGLSHPSQEFGLASCDVMVNITRNTK